MNGHMERVIDERFGSAVKVSKLVKRYGDMLALDYFDLDVREGEISVCLARMVQARPLRSIAFSRCSRSMRARCACSANR